MTDITESAEDLFQSGLNRYNAGESAETLIPVFEEVCQQSPKFSAAWTCLAWLYLLESNSTKALKAAQKALKLDPTDAQARVNLTVAMLESQKSGVRKEIEIIKQILVQDNEQIDLLKDNFRAGHKRRSDWKELTKVEVYLFD